MSDKRACVKYGKQGHQSQFYRTYVKCILCCVKHIVLLCLDLENTKNPCEDNKNKNKVEKFSKEKNSDRNKKSLANFTDKVCPV